MHILLDCDGVLANFTQASIDAHGQICHHDDIRTWNYFIDQWGMAESEFWEKCRGYDFWRNIKPYAWAEGVLDVITKMDLSFTVLTSPSNDPECVQAKIDWLGHHFGIKMGDVMVGRKKHLLANEDHILIDDSVKNVKCFSKHGGKTLLFLQPWNSDKFGGFREHMQLILHAGISELSL